MYHIKAPVCSVLLETPIIGTNLYITLLLSKTRATLPCAPHGNMSSHTCMPHTKMEFEKKQLPWRHMYQTRMCTGMSQVLRIGTDLRVRGEPGVDGDSGN